MYVSIIRMEIIIYHCIDDTVMHNCTISFGESNNNILRISNRVFSYNLNYSFVGANNLIKILEKSVYLIKLSRFSK